MKTRGRENGSRQVEWTPAGACHRLAGLMFHTLAEGCEVGAHEFWGPIQFPTSHLSIDDLGYFLTVSKTEFL
jgi:hypothetical protein